MAFRVGFMQMFVVLSLECVNIAFMLTNNNIPDIIKDFLALIIISDFDDYFFMTVTRTQMGILIRDKQIQVSQYDGGIYLTLEELTKIETTTSNRAPKDRKIENGVGHFVDKPHEIGEGDYSFNYHNNERNVFIDFKKDRQFWN